MSIRKLNLAKRGCLSTNLSDAPSSSLRGKSSDDIALVVDEAVFIDSIANTVAMLAVTTNASVVPRITAALAFSLMSATVKEGWFKFDLNRL